MAAGDGIMKPAPERLFYPAGAEGDTAHDKAMNEHVDKNIGGGVKQARCVPGEIRRGERAHALPSCARRVGSSGSK